MSSVNWNLDASHSEVTFKVKHLMINNVTGKFSTFDVSATADDDAFSNAKITFTAHTDSIDTKNEQRDAHLKGEDFFDSAKYPTITFVSTAYTKKSDDEATLNGDLTIKGITHNVALEVEVGGIAKDPWGNTKAGFTVSGKINRKDFGLTWNAALETGGVLVSDDVRFSAEIQLIKA